MEVLFMKLCPWTFSLLSIKKRGGILFFLFRSRFREKAKTECSPDMIQLAFCASKSEELLFLVEIFKMSEMLKRT